MFTGNTPLDLASACQAASYFPSASFIATAASSPPANSQSPDGRGAMIDIPYCGWSSLTVHSSAPVLGSRPVIPVGWNCTSWSAPPTLTTVGGAYPAIPAALGFSAFQTSLPVSLSNATVSASPPPTRHTSRFSYTSGWPQK